MDDLTLVVTLVVVLGSAIVGGLLARRLGQPALLGYILAGVLIGPNTPGLVTDRERVELLANVGVAFLMFALGVEFSLPELLRVRRIALLGGGLQIVLTLAFGAAVGEAIGWTFPAALLLGGAFAISSSIVAIKLLVSCGATESREAKIAFGVGVVQDPSVVPMLALLPLLAGTSDNLAIALIRSLGVAALALIAVIVVGARVVPWLLYGLARTGSRELFLMAVVVIALGAGLASQQAGYPSPSAPSWPASSSPCRSSKVRCWPRSSPCAISSRPSSSSPSACSSIPSSCATTWASCSSW